MNAQTWRTFAECRPFDAALAGERGTEAQGVCLESQACAGMLLHNNSRRIRLAFEGATLPQGVTAEMAMWLRASDKWRVLMDGQVSPTQRTLVRELVGDLLLWLAMTREKDAQGIAATSTAAVADRPAPGAAIPHDCTDGAPAVAEHISER